MIGKYACEMKALLTITDHVLGRPDTRFRKYQVFTVVLLWSLYLYKGNNHGPPVVRRLSSFLSKRLTAWQTVITTFLFFYVSQNFAKLVGLVSPEPLASMYTRDYFRATWITTALDAGFWSTMNLRPIWFRDIASIVASIYYLFRAEQADIMVKKVLGVINIDFMRVSWNKARSPYLALATDIMRPRFMRTQPRKIVIHRPPWSQYTEPISAWLYFDGPIEHLKRHDKIVLDIPGGGFVAMDPRCHDDKLLEWAGKSGLPVVALDYRKAPEHPYPYALNECHDAYCELVRTKGRCVGLAGDVSPKIVVSGDSAGGNLAVGMTLMLVQTVTTRQERGRESVPSTPVPEGLVLTYPALDTNMSIWMTPQQIDLMRRKRAVNNKGILDRKNEDYRRLQPKTPYGSGLFDESSPSGSPTASPRRMSLSDFGRNIAKDTDLERAERHSLDAGTKEPVGLSVNPSQSKRPFKTSLAMSSMISYFHDRVLSPELMRAMLLLYVGEHNQPDFATDYLLSPLLAPDELLAQFPKVYMLTGERDPLSDDTVLFAGRLRQAHEERFISRQELGLESSRKLFNVNEHVEYVMVPGISHGFLQFVNIYPAGWKYVAQCRHWMMELFKEADKRSFKSAGLATNHKQAESPTDTRDSRRSSENDIDDSQPLEMSSLPRHSISALEAQSLREEAESKNGQKAAQIYSSGRRSPASTRKTLSRLTSTDNLIDRRMKGLTMNIMGAGEASGQSGSTQPSVSKD
ncbi:hypothetical protein AMS68_003261 [Peltaster fructicola]|uniref:Alpha/beta hydrolase fold-3 domain-containing protein n=1 Tax=Peltaster fructicola TaxID=286661 RepID=A0A6H0XSN2_9PEZI|nr:hypothetical protein AMS68_003261 [Peltaster fructicola]